MKLTKDWSHCSCSVFYSQVDGQLASYSQVLAALYSQYITHIQVDRWQVRSSIMPFLNLATLDITHLKILHWRTGYSLNCLTIESRIIDLCPVGAVPPPTPSSAKHFQVSSLEKITKVHSTDMSFRKRCLWTVNRIWLERRWTHGQKTPLQ